MRYMQNQQNPQEAMAALESVVRDIELANIQINESLQLIKAHTAAAHATLQQCESSLVSGKNDMNQKLQALIKDVT